MKCDLLDCAIRWAERIQQSEQMRQGWLLVDVNGSGILGIQRYDEDPHERFNSDDEALDFVLEQVFMGANR